MLKESYTNLHGIHILPNPITCESIKVTLPILKFNNHKQLVEIINYVIVNINNVLDVVIHVT